MTNTLHRYGGYGDQHDDFIIFMMPTKGVNEEGAVEKQKEFLRCALKYDPVNLGDATKGGWHRPSKRMNPLIHWSRPSHPDPQMVIDGVDGPSTVSAVFDNFESLTRFVKELKELDLGLSVNISALVDKATECCRSAGFERHSVEYSLGFQGGGLDRLPDRRTLELSTMCGHGMISPAFARKMVDWVKTGRRSPEEAARYLARFCVCGIFNPSRAIRILNKTKTSD